MIYALYASKRAFFLPRLLFRITHSLTSIKQCAEICRAGFQILTEWPRITRIMRGGRWCEWHDFEFGVPMNFKKLVLLAGVSLLPANAFAANSDADLITKLKAENAKLKQQIETLSGKTKKDSTSQPTKVTRAPTSTAILQPSADLSVHMFYDNWQGSFEALDYDLQPTVGLGDRAVYLGVSGRALVPFADQFGVQIDAGTDQVFGNEQDVTTYVSASPIGAHALYRTDGYQIGAFGGTGHTNVGAVSEYKSQIYGIEGQTYLGNMTIWAQLGRIHSEYSGSPSSYSLDVNQIRSGLRYFVDDNTRLDLEGGYLFGNQDTSVGGSNSDASVDYNGYPSIRTNAVQWQLGAERLTSIGTFPVSLFATYSGSKWLDTTGTLADCNSGCDSFNWKFGGTDHTVKIGFSLKFGPDTLLAQDRHGVNTDMNFITVPVANLLTGATSVSLTP